MIDGVRHWIERQQPRRHATALARRLPGIGLLLGALGGALYSAQSARHMIVPAEHDKLLVGALLTIIASMVGWLAGTMLAATAQAAGTGDRRVRNHEGGSSRGDGEPGV